MIVCIDFRLRGERMRLRGINREAAFDNEATIDINLMEEARRVEGGVVRDEEDLLKMLPQRVASDDINEVLHAVVVGDAQRFVQEEEAGGSAQFAWKRGDSEGQAQGEGDLVGGATGHGGAGGGGAGGGLPDTDPGGGAACDGAFPVW